MNLRISQYITELFQSLLERVTKQISFPSPLRALIEIAMFSGVFLAAGYISVGVGVSRLLDPLVPVVLVCMLASVVSGVYRRDITNSIMNIYVHSAYGFLYCTIGFLVVIAVGFPQFYQPKFIFFFLFFSFFVTNTVRPLVSGTDFRDGGGRRQN